VTNALLEEANYQQDGHKFSRDYFDREDGTRGRKQRINPPVLSLDMEFSYGGTPLDFLGTDESAEDIYLATLPSEQSLRFSLAQLLDEVEGKAINPVGQNTRFTSRMAETMRLYYLEGLSLKGVADRLGTSRSTVVSALSLARKMLRPWLEENVMTREAA
jgi:hypothetical protein